MSERVIGDEDAEEQMRSWNPVQSVLKLIVDSCKDVGIDDDWEDLGLGKIEHDNSAVGSPGSCLSSLANGAPSPIVLLSSGILAFGGSC
jgi:hypothetical protein